MDYRVGTEEMKRLVTEKLNGLECYHGLDCISSKGTWIPISQMLSPSTLGKTSYLSVTSGAHRYDEPEVQKDVKILYTFVGTAHAGKYRPGAPMIDEAEYVLSDPEWAFVLYRYVGRMLADGRMSGHPWEVVEGGLEGVQKGLQRLADGKAKGVKYVYHVGGL